MIKPAEFMIGNWYFDGEEKQQFLYFEPKENKVHCKYGWAINDDSIDPIPLDDEILAQAFGRTTIEDGRIDVWYDNDAFMLEICKPDKRGKYLWGKYRLIRHDEVDGSIWVMSRCINYVHELQNIYKFLERRDIGITFPEKMY